MLQETLPAWKEAAESSKQPRFPWNQHLDMPLRQFAYDKAKQGWKQDQVRTEVRFRLWSKGVAVTPYLENCIKIGVSAGYSEYRSLKGENMEEKIENPTEEGINYEEEMKKAVEQEQAERKEVPKWMPKPGLRKIRIIGELVPYEKDYGGGPVARAAVNLFDLKEQAEYVHFMTRSTNPDSNYQQFCRLAVRHGKALDGIVAEVNVSEGRSKKGKRYLILNFSELEQGQSAPSPSSSDELEAFL